MHTDKQRLLAAVNLLIRDEDPRSKVQALEEAFGVAQRHPIALGGELGALNPLLELRQADYNAWQQVKHLIDTYRERARLQPCWPDDSQRPFAERKNEYQRLLMQRIRERTGRAVAIENAQRPLADRLMGAARLEFERRAQAEWGQRRDALLARARESAGGHISRAQQTELREAFWQQVDRELDAMEDAVRQELAKPTGQRRKILPQRLTDPVTSEVNVCHT